ncbi:hypothetical protein N7451_012910 [Penicillium sp. IBT 35674x]|nr:hypothetical protein N7451_012910 [Penicillium sp. IBT 35674x]
MLNRISIPRLPNRHKALQTRRTARACDECRSRKIKCDGDRPKCTQCTSAAVEDCLYSESKQDKDRKQLESANREVDRYEELLREVAQEVDVSVARKISKALRLSPRDLESRGDASSASSTSSESSVGSLDALDTLNEDVNRSKASIATGYHGKSSEVAWMQSLALKAGVDQADKEGTSKGILNQLPPISDSLASVDYHIESADYPGTRHENENPYTLPAKALAERLLSLYLDSVQPSLPIIRQTLFVEQFNSLYSRNSIQPGRKCLVEDHEDLQQVQAETLATFFLLTSSQINRAWKMIGTATRSAITLGLHLRATHNKLGSSALEARHKLWWPIFILESLLSVMIGRASGLGNSFCSAPPPLATEDIELFTDDAPEVRLERPTENPPMKWTIHQQHEQLEAQRAAMKHMGATDEHYVFCLTDLILISHTASTRVYSTDTVKQGWDQIQSRLDFFNKIMDEWSSNLPESISFQFIAILSILPDQPDRIWVCHVLWWNILHFLVQATTILLLNLSLGNLASKEQSGENSIGVLSAEQSPAVSNSVSPEAVLTAARKALQWLYCLGKTDVSARRAFQICGNCIRRIAPTGFDLDEFSPVNTESNTQYSVVPTDRSHQQRRCKDDVSYLQFVGTPDFEYDRSAGAGARRLEQ